MRKLYLVGAVLGIVLPYYYFLPFVIEHGLDLRHFFSQLFQNCISAFFGMDVAISSLVLSLLVFSEGRLGMKNL
jgi:hypothetical protein